MTAGADVLLFEAPAVDFRLSVLGMVNCDLEEVDFLLEEEGVAAADVDAVEVLAAAQVWSLTQFNSVDFSPSKIGVKKCVFNKRTIKVCVSCC